MPVFEQALAHRLGSRKQAFIAGVLVIRASARRALTLVAATPASPCVSTTVQEVWSADKAFTWIVHDEDKMLLHDLRTKKISRIPHPSIHRIRAVRPAMNRARVVRRGQRSGRDYHQQIIYEQITRRRAFPWRAPLRRAVRTLLLPRGLAVLVVPARTDPANRSASPVVVDVLTTVQSGVVCNLWGSALQPLVLEARRHFPHMHAGKSPPGPATRARGGGGEA